MTCWFCGQIPENPKKSLNLNMYGEVDSKTSESVTKVAYNVRKIEVPRCESCKDRHRLSRLGIVVTFIMLVVAIIAVSITLLEVVQGIFAGILIGLFLGLTVAGFAIKVSSLKGIKSIHNAKTVFPEVKELLLMNYKFGKSPKDYEKESKENKENISSDNSQDS